MKYVGAELDAVSDCAKFRCFFENFDGPAFAANSKRGGEAANTAANNQNRGTVGH